MVIPRLQILNHETVSQFRAIAVSAALVVVIGFACVWETNAATVMPEKATLGRVGRRPGIGRPM